MVQRIADVLPDLYEVDETAWLEAMSELIQQGRFNDLDYHHLSEYLTDMAIRDRREVKSCLTVLLAHVPKWTYQPEKRTKSWRKTTLVQQQELADLLTSGVLRNHAEAILNNVYVRAVERTVVETELPAATFPNKCPYDLDQLLSVDVTDS